MRIRLHYLTDNQKEIEISKEDYCQLHADLSYGNYFPQNSFNKRMQIIDPNQKDEFDLWLMEK